VKTWNGYLLGQRGKIKVMTPIIKETEENNKNKQRNGGRKFGRQKEN
jgi:hypothetical protein